MSLTKSEFAVGLALLGDVETLEDACYMARLGPVSSPGEARISFEPLPEVTLGGLLALPRARVSILFYGGSREMHAEFIRRFDLTFQRGGG